MKLELELSKTDERRWCRLARYWGDDIDLLFAAVLDEMWQKCGKDVAAQERLQKRLNGRVKQVRTDLGRSD
ncbi:MAG: hypothetical protein ACI4R9_09305 [Kiritimatiellia bacterium]